MIGSEGLSRMSDPATIGPQFFTPGQLYFRQQAQGYDGGAVPNSDDWPDEGGGLPNCNRIHYYSDGTVDAEQLEPTDVGWLEPGGPDLGVNPVRSL